jgi:hypothetical protein
LPPLPPAPAPITFADFDARYKNLKEKYPDIGKCSVKGCNNPRDITPGLGVDSSCAYHRLLFDYWIYEVVEGNKANYYFTNQRERRAAFTRWRNNAGKETCDKIVLALAQEGINWQC